MSMLCYRKSDGRMVNIRNPSEEDLDEFWRDWLVQNGSTLRKRAVESFRDNNPFLRYICA